VTEKADSFDAQVMSGVKAQGARYGLTY
jgi:hypothetical protein